jgi:hypothetical protein
MRRSRGLFRPSKQFTPTPFSAVYTITMFGFDLRQGQASWRASPAFACRRHLDPPAYALTLRNLKYIRARLEAFFNNPRLFVFTPTLLLPGSWDDFCPFAGRLSLPWLIAIAGFFA